MRQFDQEEAERLVNAYSDLILRLSYTYLKSTHDAEDICQTVFLKLLTGGQAFDSPAHEKAWIIRAAANACKDLLRSAAAHGGAGGRGGGAGARIAGILRAGRGDGAAG